MPADYEELEARVGYRFKDRALLQRALTHKSVHSDAAADSAALRDNEQLEFLGDSILGFLASEFFFRRCPQWPEGKLTRLKAQRVNASHLFQTAAGLSLGQYLQLGRGEEQSGGRTKKAILANAMEALIAAIYLDGGLEASRSFVEARILEAGPSVEIQEDVQLDAKSALQELAQARKLPIPRYQIVQQKGPGHAKLFTVEARVGEQFAARAEGQSKKAAAQTAAALLLEQLHAEGGAAPASESGGH
jgi:ribonuclease-3